MPTRTEQTRARSRFFRTEPLTLNSCRSLHYARGNESIIYFTELCKPVETYVYVRKSTHLQVIPQQSTQTNQTCGYRQYHKKKTVVFFINTARASTLALAITFQVPLQKFPFLLRYTISCFKVAWNLELPAQQGIVTRKDNCWTTIKSNFIW